MAKKLRVFLIVEAGQTGLSTRKMILETAGYNVLSAISARDALAMSQEHATAAVLFDVDVHDLSARDFVESLKRERPDRPVFVLASRPWPPEELKGVVDGVFDKMSDPQEMLATLDAHFNGDR